MVILSVDGKRGMESNEGYNYSEGEGSSSSGGGGGKGRRKGRKSSKNIHGTKENYPSIQYGYCDNNKQDESLNQSSLSSSNPSTTNPIPKKQKKLTKVTSEAETKMRTTKLDERKEKRAVEEKHIRSEKKSVDDEVMKRAEARLKYLLNQSDIFSHFGVGKEITAKKDDAISMNKRKRGGVDGGKHRISSNGEGEEEAGEEEMVTTFLTSQPRCISGGKLRHYQLEGLNWMIRLNENGINGILADEMGLGKTLQSISILAYMREQLGVKGPHLVVVPKSTLSSWISEIKRWCPSIRPLQFHGTKEERAEVVVDKLKPTQPDKREWDVCVTTYEISNKERTSLQKIAWRYLIIDEAHRLKNESSIFSSNIRLLKCQHRLLLTGTPLQNNLHELWALLNFLLPDVFSSSEQFDEWFNLDVADDKAKQRMISQLHKILRPFMLRRLKADVEKSLPPKTETILFVGLSAKQKEVYRNVLMRDMEAVNGTGSGSSAGRNTLLNIVMQLRKCCNHPYLFAGVEDRTLHPLGEHLVQSCGKMVLLDKLLNKLFERGHRVLIFSQMTRLLDILEDFMVMRQYRYCRIDGSTSYEDREDQIEVFNSKCSDKFVFMLSTRAGGLGINLQTADTVILFDSDWNPQCDLQAMDRAHRIGQKKPVNVYRLVTQNTVEEKVVERAQQKLKMDAMVVQQGRLASKEKVGKEELLDALRFGADTVFRSKESSVSDDDIDAILAAGEARTRALEAKTMQAADKGNMLDFRLDGGGLYSQTFEGTDYSKLGGSGPCVVVPAYLLEPGKRERKVTSYKENVLLFQKYEGPDGPSNKTKRNRLPKHLRLPRMDEWQFFGRDRLKAIHEIEEAEYMRLKKDGQLPPGDEPRVLEPEMEEEKQLLLSKGFPDWYKQHYQLFVRASARFGKKDITKISAEVGKSEAEVGAYAKAFWERGKQHLSPVEWEKNTKMIERGERKLEEISRMSEATATFMKKFENPWEQLYLGSHGPTGGRFFTAAEDRYLLCMAHKYGYGAWNEVKAAIRRCERFRFDYYLRSCSAEALGKRCEVLMKAAERENIEWERRYIAALSAKYCIPPKGGCNGNSINEGGGNNQLSLKEWDQRLKEEGKQVGELRSLMGKERLKQLEGQNAQLGLPKMGNKSSTMNGDVTQSQCASKGTSTGSVDKRKMVPNHLMPVLAAMVEAVKSTGMEKLVTRFVSKYPEVSKRQAEKKIQEIAVKKKLPGASMPLWSLRPEFAALTKGDAAAVQQKQDDKPSSAITLVEGTKVVKNGEGGKADAAAAKRKRKNSTAVVAGSGPPQKKPRNPYSYFKDDFRELARKEVESLSQPDTTSMDQTIKQRLKVMWNNLDISKVREYEKKAAAQGYKFERQ